MQSLYLEQATDVIKGVDNGRALVGLQEIIHLFAASLDVIALRRC
jgi:hypothetical protein